MEIKPCKCGDFPRVRTNGGSYVLLRCATCGYECGSFLNNFVPYLIERWNESDRDRAQQVAGAAAFDRMVEFCQETPKQDEPVKPNFFTKLMGLNKKGGNIKTKTGD